MRKKDNPKLIKAAAAMLVIGSVLQVVSIVLGRGTSNFLIVFALPFFLISLILTLKWLFTSNTNTSDLPKNQDAND